MRLRLIVFLVLALIILVTAGCGGYVARRIAQAPNTYPQWIAPEARVELAFRPGLLTNFSTHRVEVGPPVAQLTYRIVDPAQYRLKVTSTNWVRRGKTHFKFTFDAKIPAEPNQWSSTPRGTILLLHGHGLAQFSTAPWALRLAEEGWRCVLVNLRGHGTSTGRRVYFGTQEIYDMSQLLDQLEQEDQLIAPLSVLGESYGAALALRWKAVEPRVTHVVAVAPYAHLSDVVLNIRREYARWVPSACIQAGLTRLPGLIQVEPTELDPLSVLARDPVVALFVAGAKDRITPTDVVRRLYETAEGGSRFLVVPEATHEAVIYFLDDLAPPVLEWLSGRPLTSTVTGPAANVNRHPWEQTVLADTAPQHFPLGAQVGSAIVPLSAESASSSVP